jgi:hypothetical protein
LQAAFNLDIERAFDARLSVNHDAMDRPSKRGDRFRPFGCPRVIQRRAHGPHVRQIVIHRGRVERDRLALVVRSGKLLFD